MGRFKEKTDESGKKREKRPEQMTLNEIRANIAGQIEASEWHGATGMHIKKILTMPMDELRQRLTACRGKGPNALYEMLGVMRNGAIIMPDGYNGILGIEAVDLRLEEMNRLDYAAEQQYGDLPEAKELAKKKTIHE